MRLAFVSGNLRADQNFNKAVQAVLDLELNRSKMSGISQVQTQHANFPEWDPRLLRASFPAESLHVEFELER